MPLSPGTRLGPYEVLAPLGAGGMGEVYRARDTRLDRTVALKVLSPDLSTDPEFKARFAREARTISGLNHPHICVLHDIGTDNGTDYLVLEYLDGMTLAERLASEPRGLKLGDSVRIAIAIADALDAAHRHGLVHRDLKPGNVMLAPGGPKLLDFGLAKPGDGASAAAVSLLATRPGSGTAPGVIVGTLQYMAPEQIQGGPVDARTDIFALGAVIYEMVTGRKAFEAGAQASAIAKILEVDPPKPSSVAPVCPPALDRLIQRCLAKAPDNRWQAARDVVLELQWIAEGQAAGPAVTVVPSRRRSWLPWSIAAVAVVGAIAAWALRPSPSTIDLAPARFDVPMPAGMSPPTDWLGPPRLSPDGRYVVMAADSNGRIQLHLRPLDGTSFTPIPGTEGGRSPFWSPDSDSIAFFTSAGLQRIDLSGGPPRTLCEADGTTFGGSWSPGGDILFAIDSPQVAGVGSGIRHVRDTGGTARQVTTLDESRGETAHRYPQFLPDGRSFVFSVSGRGAEIRAASLENRTTRLLIADAARPAFVPPGTLLFLRQGSVLAIPFDPRTLEVTGAERVVVSQRAGGFSATAHTIAFFSVGEVMRRIQWVTRDGRRSAVVGEPGPYLLLSLSPSGRRVALQRRDVAAGSSSADIWVLEFGTGVLSRVTSDPGYEGDPSWSPDEQSLAFTAIRQGSPHILRKDLTTGSEAPFGTTPQPGNVDEWTRDGRFVIFRTAGRTIQALAATGDQPPQVVADLPGGIVDQAHVSPDGRRIAFNGNESGRWEVYIATFPGFTGKRQVSNKGGVQPVWGSDGRELFYLDPSGRVMAVDAPAGDTAGVGVPRALFETTMEPVPSLDQFAVARDGRFLVLEPMGGARPSIGFVLNWQKDAM